MVAFGQQIEHLKKDLTGRSHMGGEAPNRLRAIMQIVISVIILGAGFYALFGANTSEVTHKVMTGLMGTVVGYWLR